MEGPDVKARKWLKNYSISSGLVGPIFTENSSGRKFSSTRQTDKANSQVCR